MANSQFSLDSTAELERIKNSSNTSNAKNYAGVQNYDIISDYNFVKVPNQWLKRSKYIIAPEGINVISGGTYNFTIKELSYFIGNYRLYCNVYDSGGDYTITTPDFAYRMIDYVELGFTGDKRNRLTGDQLFSVWMTKNEPDEVRTKLHTLAGGDSLTITSAKTVIAKLYGPGSTHIGNELQPFNANASTDKELRITVKFKTFANMFTAVPVSGAAPTQFTVQLKYDVYWCDNMAILKNMYNMKYYKTWNLTKTLGTTAERFNISSIRENGAMKNLIILARKATNMAAGTLTNYNTSDSEIKSIKVFKNGSIAYSFDYPIEYDEERFQWFDCDGYLPGTTYAADRIFIISWPIKHFDHTDTEKEVVANGLEINTSDQYEIEMTFADSASRVFDFVAEYEALVKPNSAGQFEIELIK